MGERWQKPAGKYIFFYEKGNESYELGAGFFTQKNHISS
jgi:hypothetical protein